ncbi:MAG: DUF3574 domain-containing protein [Gemmatimonadota bacterium]|nr:DUF3574 domain-containing protein [Gemmatimonadota bacterium]MDE3172662.1 DUF3574 domain-containing protein [Gemmatimonadota bacterium]
MAAATAGCASLPRSGGLRDAVLERLYFGRNIGDTAVVSDSAWAAFVRDVITPEFPRGATIWGATGQWLAPAGNLVRERTFVVELLHAPTTEADRRVDAVIAAYKRQFAQESVLRTVTKVRAGY